MTKSSRTYWHTELAKHILAQHPELVLHQDVAKPNDGTTLLLPPVHHHFRYILLGRTRKGSWFHFGCGIQPLYSAEDAFHQSCYDRIPDPGSGHFGGHDTSNPDVYNVIDRATPVGLAKLTAVETPSDLIQFYETVERIGGDPRVWALSAMGRFDDAQQRLTIILTRFRRSFAPDAPYWQWQSWKGLVRLETALGQGPSAVLDLLRENERNTVAMLHLEKYWQPTPFPFETPTT